MRFTTAQQKEIGMVWENMPIARRKAFANLNNSFTPNAKKNSKEWLLKEHVDIAKEVKEVKKRKKKRRKKKE